MFKSGFEKTSGLGLLNGANKFVSAVSKGATSQVGKQLMKSHAVTGALAGGAAGAMSAQDGEGFSGALKGAALGAAGGAASGAIQSGMARNAVAGAASTMRSQKMPGAKQMTGAMAGPVSSAKTVVPSTM